jgi:comEA protein
MLDLTSSEKRTIFIISGILIVAGLFYVFQSFIEKPEIIDYSKSDSVFSRLTHMPPSPEKNSNDNTVDKTQNSVLISEKSKPAVKIENNSIDINTADEKELEKLPRIGPAMANRIIDYRKKNGSFKSIDELTNVKGIGKKTLNLIKPYLQEIQ